MSEATRSGDTPVAYKCFKVVKYCRPPGLDEYFLKYLTEGFDRCDVPSSASQCDLNDL